MVKVLRFVAVLLTAAMGSIGSAQGLTYLLIDNTDLKGGVEVEVRPHPTGTTIELEWQEELANRPNSSGWVFEAPTDRFMSEPQFIIRLPNRQVGDEMVKEMEISVSFRIPMNRWEDEVELPVALVNDFSAEYREEVRSFPLIKKMISSAQIVNFWIGRGINKKIVSASRC